MRRSALLLLIALTASPAFASDYTGLFYALMIGFSVVGLVCSLITAALCAVLLSARGRAIWWPSLLLVVPLATIAGILVVMRVDPQSFEAMFFIVGLFAVAGTGAVSFWTSKEKSPAAELTGGDEPTS